MFCRIDYEEEFERHSGIAPTLQERMNNWVLQMRNLVVAIQSEARKAEKAGFCVTVSFNENLLDEIAQEAISHERISHKFCGTRDEPRDFGILSIDHQLIPRYFELGIGVVDSLGVHVWNNPAFIARRACRNVDFEIQYALTVARPSYQKVGDWLGHGTDQDIASQLFGDLLSGD